MDNYNTLLEYIRGKATPDGSEELSRLRLDLDKSRDQVLKFNTSLNTEFENYAKYRSDSLKRIMSCSCHSQRERARKVGEFASDQQKNFPLYECQDKSPAASPKKAATKRETEEIEDLQLAEGETIHKRVLNN